MQDRNPLAPLIAVAAMAIAACGFYVAHAKRSCECPRPAIHDGDHDEFAPRKPLRPRRPDGSTGDLAPASSCPDGKCDVDTSGVKKRDM